MAGTAGPFAGGSCLAGSTTGRARSSRSAGCTRSWCALTARSGARRTSGSPFTVKRIEGERPGARQLARCDILNLVLGPLDLNLLGLEVHLNRVVLNIVAVSGTGNLLGNLLCAVAGLLDNGGVLRQISQILNSILAILRL